MKTVRVKASTAVSAAIGSGLANAAAHATAAAPHSGHATPESVAAAVATHVADQDPHEQYAAIATLFDDSAAAGNPYLAYPPDDGQTGTVYLWAHPAALAGHAQIGRKEVFVPAGVDPVDGLTVYYGTALDTCGVSTRVPSMTDTALCKVAQHVAHTSLTKTGTWTTTHASIAAGALTAAGATSSGTAGDTISGSVSGKTIGVQFLTTSNGGYGVVAIDGDYTRPNRLPKVTQAEIDAGRFRQADLGRAYYDCYADTVKNDAVVIADDLPAGSHTITVQVTGTARAGAVGVRCYVEHFWTAAAGTPGAAGFWMEPIYQIAHFPGGSAHTWVAQWAPEGSTSWQFLGDVHSDNASQSREITTLLEWRCNAVDQTALAAGSWASGTIVVLRHNTTLAHAADLATPVATKSRIYTFAPRPFPVQCETKIEFTAAGSVLVEYPVMMPVGGGQYYGVWSSALLDRVAIPFTNINNNAVVRHPAITGQLKACGDYVEAYASILHADPPIGFRSAGSAAAYQDRTTAGQEKIYVMGAGMVQHWPAGTKVTYLVGFAGRLKA